MAILLALTLVAEPVLPEIQYQPGNGVSQICGVSASGPEALIKQVMALPGIEMHEQIGDYLTLIQVRERRFWTFVQNDNPAAPAVICRTITPAEDGRSKLAMEVSCFADKASCDRLVRDFVAHNNRVLRGEAP